MFIFYSSSKLKKFLEFFCKKHRKWGGKLFLKNIVFTYAVYSKLATFTDFENEQFFPGKTHLRFAKSTEISYVLRPWTFSVACYEEFDITW